MSPESRTNCITGVGFPPPPTFSPPAKYIITSATVFLVLKPEGLTVAN